MGANRRKVEETPGTVSSTSTSAGTPPSGNAANHDQVTYFVQLTTIAAGSVTFKLQISPNGGTTWHDLSAAEMTGDTGSITTTGNYHISSAAPIGTSTRLFFTIVTGPIAFTYTPVFSKSGSVH